MRLRPSCMIVLVLLAAVSLSFVRYVGAASNDLSLPSSLVTIEVSNGTQSYFSTVLSRVASGYDVSNGTYLGWCVDRRTSMPRSPVTHQVTLYSSSSPPLNLVSQKWDMVNYILNHKEGSADDVQQAIWYFINLVGNYSPSNIAAKFMVADALENGAGFTPAVGQLTAVICYPEATDVQVTIIEVTVPNPIPEFSAFWVLPLFMLATVVALLVLKRGRRR
jgi:hypothetical protein